MKNWTKRISAALLCGTLLCGGWTQTAFAGAKDMRAVWIATVYSSDYPSALNDAEAQKQEFIDKLDKIKAMGMNAVAVQVRPKGDAFYESGLNPWSEVLTGTQGQYPGYDTMAFMIEETHKRGMEFHAWMNPYRITTSGTDLTELSADNMARKHPDWILSYNGAMYYNPAKEEVKQYICDSVEEIVKNYDVDAIHFDDYFYPSNYPLPEGEGRDGAEASGMSMIWCAVCMKRCMTQSLLCSSVSVLWVSGKTILPTRPALPQKVQRAIIPFSGTQKHG